MGNQFMEKLLDGVKVEWKALGEVATIGTGSHDTKDAIEDGEFIFYARGREPLRLNTFDFDETAIITAGDGVGVGKVFHYATGKYALHQRAYRIVPAESVNPRFLYHYIVSHFYAYIKKTSVHASVTSLRRPMFLKFQVPIPCPENPQKSLAIQAEIVRILDAFTALTAELAAELTMRKKQYDYYRDQLLSFSDSAVDWKALGEVAVIGTGSHDTKDAIDDGEYIFYARGREPLKLNTFDFDETAIITAGDGVGVGKVYHYAQGKYALHQRAYRIVPSEAILPRFVYHYITAHFYEYVQKASVSSSVTSLRKPMFLNFQIPLPSLEDQTRIVKILDKFDTLTNSITEGLPHEIELRQKQYEYYRDLLFAFPQSEKVTA